MTRNSTALAITSTTGGSRASVTPRNLRIVAAVAYSGISRSELYRLAAAGRVRFIKSGATTLVDVASLDAYIDGLPAAPIATHS